MTSKIPDDVLARCADAACIAIEIASRKQDRAFIVADMKAGVNAAIQEYLRLSNEDK